MELSVEDKLLLSVVKLHSTIQELKYINALLPLITNWESLLDTLIAHGSGPLLYKKLPLLPNSAQIPPAVTAKLQQAYYKTLSRSMVLYDTFRKVVEAFAKAGIEIIALKGVYLSEWLYEDIALRQFSDLDLLVRKEDGAKCLEILANMGFKSCNSNVSKFIGEHTEIVHYMPMLKNDISVEIHIKLHRSSKSYNINIKDFISHSEPVTLNNIQVRGLCLHHLIIHLCVHLAKHFDGGHVQMKCFNDIVNLLNKYKVNFDWDAFIVTCRDNECEQSVFRYLMLIHYFYKVDLPSKILENYGKLLTESDKNRFMQFLHCQKIRQYHVTTHWKNMKYTSGMLNKLHYFVELIFPPKSFMLEKYSIKHTRCYWLWYPYRWGIGAKGVLKLAIKSLPNLARR